MEQIRLNKYLSDIGYCSRRKADDLVSEGKVFVNGCPASMGMKVSDEDEIMVDGAVLSKKREEVKPVLLAFHKPKGIVCSSNGQGATTIDEYIHYPVRVYSIGRLDKDSEGLLLLTNQGELVNQISKSRYYHEKEYVVTLWEPVTDEFLTKMRSGVEILDTVTRPCKVWKTGEKTFHIVLTQGLNRQIRRMCRALSMHVRDLKRIRIMNIRLGDLECGALREVTEEEAAELYQLLKGKQAFVQKKK